MLSRLLNNKIHLNFTRFFCLESKRANAKITNQVNNTKREPKKSAQKFKNFNSRIKMMVKNTDKTSSNDKIIGVIMNLHLCHQKIKQYFSENISNFYLRPILNEFEEHQTFVITKTLDNNKTSDIFIFEDHNVVVFWNTSTEDIENIKHILRICSDKDETQLEEETEELRLLESDSDKTHFTNGIVYINKEKNWHEAILDKYVVSYTINNSLKLGRLEDKHDDFIESLRKIQMHKIPWYRKLFWGSIYRDLLLKMSTLNDLRIDLNVDSDLLSDPDFLWDFEDKIHLFNRISSYFDIPKRASLMNSNLNYAQTITESFGDHIQSVRSCFLEVLIIILIFYEGVIPTIHLYQSYSKKD